MSTANLPSFLEILLRLEYRDSNFDFHFMASHKLPNYLRVHRKRLGLSQHEVAFLLGWRDASQPSRYEHFSRTPTLRTALALAVILQMGVHELFLGEYQKVEDAVSRQAQRLEARLTTGSPDRRTARKLSVLKLIMSTNRSRS
jgi:transcriptional regulator with XRE-family HTH domain